MSMDESRATERIVSQKVAGYLPVLTVATRLVLCSEGVSHVY